MGLGEQATPSQPKNPQIIQRTGIPTQESFGRPTVLTTYPHWQYFLALERDLIETTYYVEMAAENFRTFSVAYARLFLTAGSEIDVLCKLLCHQINAATKAEKIDEYRQEITASFPRFPSMRVLVPRYALVLEPWVAWSEQDSPQWWGLHQKVKHERHAYYQAANLENTLQAVAALFCLVLYHYQPTLYAGELLPWTQFFGLEHEPEHLMSEANYKLPDF
jgi:hypothetical protein